MEVKCTASALKIRSLPEGSLGTDTGARLVLNDIVPVYGTSLDGAWLFVGSNPPGWVSKMHTTPVSETLASLIRPPVPRGYDGIIVVFGQPAEPACSRGRAKLPAPLSVSWEPQPITVFACHEKMAGLFTTVFAEIHHRGLWALLQDFGGCYNYRPVKGSSKLSTHAWGISVDINTKQNPLGATPKMDSRIVDTFNEFGFAWGGKWSRPDGMHFQYAIGY